MQGKLWVYLLSSFLSKQMYEVAQITSDYLAAYNLAKLNRLVTTDTTKVYQSAKASLLGETGYRHASVVIL